MWRKKNTINQVTGGQHVAQIEPYQLNTGF